MTAPVLADAMGPRARRRAVVASVVAGAAIAYLVVLAVRRLDANNQLLWDNWRPFTKRSILKFFLGGLGNTVRAAVTAMGFAVVVGGLVALLRLSRSRPPRWVARGYVEFFRGLPLYVLILFCGFGLPRLGIRFSPFWFLVTALSIYNSAILAEIFRAGILSLDRGQGEAASAIGLGYWQSMAFVIVPQAVRRMVPAIISQLVTLLKDTSLGGLIFYEELLSRGRINAEFTQRTLPSLTVVATMYIAVNFTLSAVAVRLEARQRRRYGAGKIEVAGAEDVALVAAKGDARLDA
ncbi:MAG TPA: amino acid ABC transporter permease [Acidimicrobiales bacterium]|nr:amino acid ABC transporter permease [Acidimicrobiales bacterium]